MDINRFKKESEYGKCVIHDSFEICM